MHKLIKFFNFNKINSMNSITQGNILKSLLKFFFPLLLGTFFMQLYNTIDAIIVGRFVGKIALAAVGGSPAVFVNLIVGFFNGVASGSSVIISQYYGAKDADSLHKAVDTSILMSIAGGIILTLAGIFFTKPVLIITKCPEEVIGSSFLYLVIYFSGLIPMFVYNIIAGVMRGTGDSKTPLVILIIGCFSNRFLDLVFVFFLKAGIAGVAVATVICQIESALISICVLRKRKEVFNYRFSKMKMDLSILSKILRIGLPAGFQGSLYVISNLIIQSNINYFGTNTIAGWAVYSKIDGIFWMTVATFGLALTTFSGQNYGAGTYGRIKKATWITFALSFAATAIIVFCFLYWSENIYRLFTNDTEVLAKGIEIVKYLAPFYFVYLSIEILSGTVRGAGKSFAPTMITVFGICGLRLLWLFIAVPQHQTLTTVLISYPLTWTVTSIAFWTYFLSNKWLVKN